LASGRADGSRFADIALYGYSNGPRFSACSQPAAPAPISLAPSGCTGQRPAASQSTPAAIDRRTRRPPTAQACDAACCASRLNQSFRTRDSQSADGIARLPGDENFTTGSDKTRNKTLGARCEEFCCSSVELVAAAIRLPVRQFHPVRFSPRYFTPKRHRFANRQPTADSGDVAMR
jgi:hypothetical protein